MNTHVQINGGEALPEASILRGQAEHRKDARRRAETQGSLSLLEYISRYLDRDLQEIRRRQAV